MNLLEQRSTRNGAANGNLNSVSALWTALIERQMVRAADVTGIVLSELRKTNAIKDAIADAAGTGLLGLADAAGSLLLGTQTNNTSVSESATFFFPMPPEYSPGSPITCRLRAMVTAARFVSQQCDLVARKMGDAGLGADLCTTNPKTVTLAFANYDFTITPLGMVAGDILQVDAFLIMNDTGGSTNGTGQISAISMRADSAA